MQSLKTSILVFFIRLNSLNAFQINHLKDKPVLYGLFFCLNIAIDPLLFIVYCLLSIAYCLLLILYCLLSVIYCRLYIAYCRFNIADLSAKNLYQTLHKLFQIAVWLLKSFKYCRFDSILSILDLKNIFKYCL